MSNLLPFQSNYDLGTLILNKTIVEESIYLEQDLDENHVYKFEINQAAKLNLSLDIIDNDYDYYYYDYYDANLELFYDSNGNSELDEDDESIAISDYTGNDSINYLDAATGTYFANVAYSDSSDEPVVGYDLYLSIHNNLFSFQSNYDLGVLASDKTTVEQNDYLQQGISENHVYKFEINKATNLNLSLYITNDFYDYANLELFKDSNNNGKLDDEDESISTSNFISNIDYQDAATGTYFANVAYDYGGNDSIVGYEFSLSTDNNFFRFQSNYDLGVLVLDETIVKNDAYLEQGVNENDVYKFSLDQSANLHLSLDVIDAASNYYGDNADLELFYDSNENGELDSDDESIATSNYISNIDYQDAATGTYFANVAYDYDDDKQLDYELNLFAHDNLFPFQSNYDLGVLAVDETTVKKNAYLQQGVRENDVYKFEINQTANFNLSLDIIDSDYGNLRLFHDSNNNQKLDNEDELVTVSDYLGNINFYQSATSGTYFVDVAYEDGGMDGSLNYELDLFAHNNLLPFQSNYDLGILVLNETIVEQNSYLEQELDENHVYKFELNEVASLNLSLDIINNNYNYYYDRDSAELELLYDSNNNNKLDDEDKLIAIAYSDDIDHKDAATGTYFAKIAYEYGGSNSSINYELDLFAYNNLFPFQSNYDVDVLVTNKTVEQSGYLQQGLDENHVYKFEINQTAELNLSLDIINDNYDDANLELFRDSNNNGELDDEDESIAKSYAFGSDTINYQSASSGSYFANITYYSGNEDLSLNYEFDLSAKIAQTTKASAVYRFYNPVAGVHFYTADEGERNYVSSNLDNYDYEGESYVTADVLTGNNAEAVYRFFNSATGVHLYTTSEDERDFIIDNLDNYSFEGIKFHAYETQEADTIPVHRFYEPTIGVHFYTPNEDEKTFVEENLSNYDYEGVAYYAYPD